VPGESILWHGACAFGDHQHVARRYSLFLAVQRDVRLCTICTFQVRRRHGKKTWTISEARARIADVVDAALAEGPQRIARRDREPVVVLAESDWRRLSAAYPTMVDLVMGAPVDPDVLPKRKPARVATVSRAAWA
jgi:prevent-host-death family protein